MAKTVLMNQVAVNIVLMASAYLLIALSFSLIYHTAKVFHIAHAAIISLGAYLTFFFLNNFYFHS